MHVDNGLECVRAKIPVLIEKPIADDTQSATLLVEETENAGVSALFRHCRRHNPIIRAANERVRIGHPMGEVMVPAPILPTLVRQKSAS